MDPNNLFVILLAYLLGSVPSAYVITKWAKGLDIRRLGDSNVGAANVASEVGFVAGMAVAFVDIGKGMAAVLIARQYSASDVVAMIAGLTAVLGHNWSLFIRFQGGRGAATTLGVMAVFLTKEIVVLIAIAALPFIISRNTTLAFFLLFAPLFLLALRLGEPSYLVGYSLAIPTFVGFTHYWKARNSGAATAGKKALGVRTNL